MWGRRKHARRSVASVQELCDLCGRTFPPEEAVCGHVADSSAVLPDDPLHDGLRRVTACCETHLEMVRAAYRQRPFVQEELWAGKIGRVLTSGRPVLTMTELACRTGLDEPDIRRAIAWHNERRRRLDG
ncbi:hypothetical protein AB0N20_17910 [Streptomyces griseoincarnatus]|nr:MULTISPECIES: hypothetical protein [unclassified Streptomyces]MDH3035284.1 hypothetical protein [Streptomyces sp. TRM75561]NUV52984.1 hypothetical protein [Streptomyces coelicolor]RMI93321.1 hypothetical protein BIU87_15410 [Streptomyces sp. ZS0098]